MPRVVTVICPLSPLIYMLRMLCFPHPFLFSPSSLSPLLNFVGPFFFHILRSHYFLSSPHLLPLPLLLSLLPISFHLPTDFSSCVAISPVLHLAQLRLVLSCSDSIATNSPPSPPHLALFASRRARELEVIKKSFTRDSNIPRKMMKLYMTELFGICVMKHANEACSQGSFHVESNFCSLRRPTKGQIRVAFGRNRPKMSFAVSIFIVRKSLPATLKGRFRSASYRSLTQTFPNFLFICIPPAHRGK